MLIVLEDNSNSLLSGLVWGKWHGSSLVQNMYRILVLIWIFHLFFCRADLKGLKRNCLSL